MRKRHVQKCYIRLSIFTKKYNIENLEILHTLLYMDELTFNHRFKQFTKKYEIHKKVEIWVVFVFLQFLYL